MSCLAFFSQDWDKKVKLHIALTVGIQYMSVSSPLHSEINV